MMRLQQAIIPCLVASIILLTLTSLLRFGPAANAELRIHRVCQETIDATNMLKRFERIDEPISEMFRHIACQRP